MGIDKFGRSGKSMVVTEGVSLRCISKHFLRRDGTNTATGSINMTGNTLTNVSNPVNAQDIATKNYVDGKVSKSGDTMTGNLDVSGNRVMNVPFSPTDTSDAVNEAYVVRGDLDVEHKTVLRNGTQAMTGNLDMDDHYINNLPNPVHAQDAVTKTYADTKMSRSGGTMMGDIQMTDNRITGLSDPVNNQDAATKWYVDMNTARQRLARSSSMDTAIFKQPLLIIGDTLVEIPIIPEGTMSGGIILADLMNIHITNGGLFRFEICGNCMAPRLPVPGICPEGLIRVETSSEERSDLRQLSLASHTICWTPICGHRNTSFSRFAYYRMTSGGNVSVKCQKTGSENRMLKVCLWLTIERINNSQIKYIF